MIQISGLSTMKQLRTCNAIWQPYNEIRCNIETTYSARNVYKQKVSSSFNMDDLRSYSIWRWRYCLLFPLWYIGIPLKLSKEL